VTGTGIPDGVYDFFSSQGLESAATDHRSRSAGRVATSCSMRTGPQSAEPGGTRTRQRTETARVRKGQIRLGVFGVQPRSRCARAGVREPGDGPALDAELALTRPL
jgi:hypothetical protein